MDWSTNEIIGAALALVFLLTVMHGRAEYWKARATTLDKERDSNGWIEECHFWRRIYNKEAAEAIEDRF